MPSSDRDRFHHTCNMEFKNTVGLNPTLGSNYFEFIFSLFLYFNVFIKMRWSKSEEIKIIKLLTEENKTYSEIGEVLNRTSKSIKLKLNKLGYKQEDFYIKPSNYIIKKCLKCCKEYNSLIKEGRKFCSQSCSASYNNIKNYIKREETEKSEKPVNKCLLCNNKLKNGKKYCTQLCHTKHIKLIRFSLIENGDTSLPSRNYKNYLIEKHGNQCMDCGWCKVNPYSNTIPVELEHIDGNAENNNLDNLKLLCPSCHSLTPTYRALNMGNGRYKRMERYNEGKSS